MTKDVSFFYKKHKVFSASLFAMAALSAIVGYSLLNAENPQTKIDTAQAALDKHLAGPLMSVDKRDKSFVLEELSKEYLIETDSATDIKGDSGIVSLSDLRIEDTVFVTYHKVSGKKRIAAHIYQKSLRKDNGGSPQGFTVKTLTALLLGIDTVKRVIFIRDQNIDYPIELDFATTILAFDKKIGMRDLKIGLPVYVDYRKYPRKKRIANQIMQKIAVDGKKSEKPDSLIKSSFTEKNPPESGKKDPTARDQNALVNAIDKLLSKDTLSGNSIKKAEKDTAIKVHQSPEIEASKRAMEQAFSSKTREQLYREYFHIAPPKQSREAQATLMVNELTDGVIELVFSEDRLDFTMPIEPVIKIASQVADTQMLNKMKAGSDTKGRITRKYLVDLGLQVDFDNQISRVLITIPPEFRGKQIHEVVGTFIENPYSVESIKPDFISGFLNVNANQKLNYLQEFSHDTANVSYQVAKTMNKEIRQPFYSFFNGALNIEHGVLEADVLYQEKNQIALQSQGIRAVYDFPQKGLRLSAGDIQYQTFGYMSGVRMAGVSVAKDFSLQPYILTYPVGDYQFYLADAAEAEIWVNEVMVSKMTLPAGTHDIRGFPFSTGNNNVKIILTDSYGRSQTLEFNFIYQQSLLGKGQAQYSASAGVPQTLCQGNSSYYKNEPSLCLAYRGGVTNTLTLGAYSQIFSQGVDSKFFSKSHRKNASIRSALLGADALMAIPQGTIDFGMAGSSGKAMGHDIALRLSYHYQSKLFNNKSEESKKNPISLNTPISWISQVEYIGRKFSNGQMNYLYTPDRQAFTISTGIGVPLTDQLNINANGKFYARRDTSNLLEVTFRLDKTWFGNLRAGMSFGYSSDAYGNQANPSVMFNCSYTFRSGNHNFSVNEGIVKQPMQNNLQSQTVSSPIAAQSEWGNHSGVGWNYDNPTPRPERLSASVMTNFDPGGNDYNGNVSYTGNQGTLRLTQDLSEPLNAGNFLRHQTELNLQTALVCAGGSLALSRPVYSGGFVLVKGVKNLSDSKIQINPTDLGYDATTTIFGPAVLPLFESYSLKRIRVEPMNPSLGAVAEKDKYTLFPQYKSGFSIAVGSERTLLITGALFNYDDSVFAYQGIEVTQKNKVKAEPVKTFTNGIGRFQFLGVAGGTYLIAASNEDDREPITIKIPKDVKDFYSAGNLKFKKKADVGLNKIEEKTKKDSVTETDSSPSIMPKDSSDTGKIDTISADTLKTDTTRSVSDSVKTDSSNAVTDTAQGVTDSATTDTTEPQSDSAKVKEKSEAAKAAVTADAPVVYVMGHLNSRQGKTLRLTSIAIDYLDAKPGQPPNSIYYPHSITNEEGRVQFICNLTGRYRITVQEGGNKNFSAIIEIPKGVKGRYDFGTKDVEKGKK